MKRVIIESPFAGNIESNIKYARLCMRNSLMHNEAPLASHLLYTQEGILRDDVPAERKWGIMAGFEWNKFAELVVVYQDYGITPSMQMGIERAEQLGIPIEYRKIL